MAYCTANYIGETMAEIQLKDLNRWADNPLEMIKRDEEVYHGRVGRIAEYIYNHEEIRLVLLAGPSGSGKTTTANLIADGIRIKGMEAMVISLDDFYRDHTDPNYPKNELGDHDYERPESLNLAKLEDTLKRIALGESFSVPKYDFKLGRCVNTTEHPALRHGCVIIEGLHALNPIISDNLPKNRILKLFVSVSTNINNGDIRILSGRKIRFLRRMVRDSIYRGASAERTLALWRGVLEAEDIFLYPFKATADLAFDTFHSFELGAMCNEAKKLLTPEVTENSEYARIVLSAISRVNKIEEKAIPKNSLIREFISGGIYDHIY